MTRLERFIRATASGYFVLLSNILFTLLSIRMAVRALPEEEYGTWVTTSQIGVFLALVDFGLSTAVTLYLIDHKDDKSSGHYGRMLKATFAVLMIQAGIVVLLGVVVTFASIPLLAIPPSAQHAYIFLMLGNVLVAALAFPAKIFGHLLISHQRYDSLSVAQVAQLLTQLAVLWLSFRAGAGVYSLLIASLGGSLISTTVAAALSWRPEYLPPRGAWGRIQWADFTRVFAFGQSMFFLSLGMQLLTTSQAILITRVLGLAAAGDWNVHTRSHLLVCSIIWRTFDVAFPAFAEMIARGETETLHRRVVSLIRLVLGLAAIGCAGIAIANEPFVALWLGKSEPWGVVNDVALGLWLLPLTLARCAMLVLASFKNVGRLPRVLLLESAAFVVLGVIGARFFGFAGFLGASIVCSASFSMREGVRELCRMLQLSFWKTFARLMGPAAAIVFVTAVPGAVVFAATHSWLPGFAFAANAALVIVVGGFAFWLFALDAEPKAEIARAVNRLLRRSAEPSK